jgi:hypothetical protein
VLSDVSVFAGVALLVSPRKENFPESELAAEFDEEQPARMSAPAAAAAATARTRRARRFAVITFPP